MPLLPRIFHLPSEAIGDSPMRNSQVLHCFGHGGTPARSQCIDSMRNGRTMDDGGGRFRDTILFAKAQNACVGSYRHLPARNPSDRFPAPSDVRPRPKPPHSRSNPLSYTTSLCQRLGGALHITYASMPTASRTSCGRRFRRERSVNFVNFRTSRPAAIR